MSLCPVDNLLISTQILPGSSSSPTLTLSIAGAAQNSLEHFMHMTAVSRSVLLVNQPTLMTSRLDMLFELSVILPWESGVLNVGDRAP